MDLDAGRGYIRGTGADLTLPEVVKALSLQQNVLELKRSVRIRVLIQEIRFVPMDLKEIEQCLQKYAKELNEKGGCIYLKGEESKFYIGKQYAYHGFSKVTVDGADLILDSKNSERTRASVRIPYHAISHITIG